MTEFLLFLILAVLVARWVSDSRAWYVWKKQYNRRKQEREIRRAKEKRLKQQGR